LIAVFFGWKENALMQHWIMKPKNYPYAYNELKNQMYMKLAGAVTYDRWHFWVKRKRKNGDLLPRNSFL
jgi:hypothetical protein